MELATLLDSPYYARVFENIWNDLRSEGVTEFNGYHPILEDVYYRHRSAAITQEVFALMVGLRKNVFTNGLAGKDDKQTKKKLPLFGDKF